MKTRSRQPGIDSAAAPLTRRRLLGVSTGTAIGFAASSLAPRLAAGQPGRDSAPVDEALVARQLPLDAVGLEHVGAVVPDVTAATRFFGSVFNPFVYKEKQPPLRYYVTLDPGYVALGTREGAASAFIDHDCIMAEGFDRAAMARRLELEGLPQGRFGIFPDPDGNGMQLLPIGGLAGSTEPAGSIVDAAPLVRPRGLYRVLRYASDVERAVAFYRKFLGPEVIEVPETEQAVEAVWFAAGPTWFGVQQAPDGAPPRIDRFCVNVAAGGFDRAAVARALAALGATVVDSPAPLLHFRSPEGIGVELRPVDPARMWGRT